MMTIPTIDRKLHKFRYVGRGYLVSMILYFSILVTFDAIFVVRLSSNNDQSSMGLVLLISLILSVTKMVQFLRRAPTRIEIQGDQIRYFTGKETPAIEQSLRNVENLTIRIKGVGSLGIASWRRVDFKDGQSMIFDGQVEGVEQLEDLLTERSGKQFLRWLTGEAYQKPKA